MGGAGWGYSLNPSRPATQGPLRGKEWVPELWDGSIWVAALENLETSDPPKLSEPPEAASPPC